MTATYADLHARFEEKRTDLATRIGRAQAIQDNVTTLRSKVEALAVDAETKERVAKLFQSYADEQQEELRLRVGSLVTMGLQAVFDDTLSFRVNAGVSRNQATLDFEVVSEVDGREVSSPILEARGGGVAAVVGVLLRIVVLAMHPDQPRRVLVLDEALGMVSARYHEAVALLLRRLVDEVGVQIILITHAPAQGSEADIAYRLTHDGSRTVATPVDPSGL